MSGFTKIKKGGVTIEHHQTASVISITVESVEPTENGGSETIVKEIWLDYCSFDELFEAIKEAKQLGI